MLSHSIELPHTEGTESACLIGPWDMEVFESPTGMPATCIFWIVAYCMAWGHAGLRIWRVVVYPVRRWKGIGHMAFVVFTPYFGWQGTRVLVSWFLSHPMPVRIWVVCALLSFRFSWIMEDHGSLLLVGCRRFVLSAVFVSFCFGSVWLVRRRYIPWGG